MCRLLKIVVLFFCVFVVAGCSVQQPDDASDPEASNAWFEHALKKAGKYRGTEREIIWLKEAYIHAEHLKEAAGAEALQYPVNGIPEKVRRIAVKTRNLDGFKWAADHEALKNPTYQELVEYWNCGTAWAEIALNYSPNSLPAFMSLAFEAGNFRFFAWHAEEFKAANYYLGTSFEAMRYRQFLIEELDEAVYRQDRNRIGFLLDYFPDSSATNFTNRTTRDRLKKLGDYISYKLKDEMLACKLIKLRPELNELNLDTLTFGDEFYACLRKYPDYAIRTLKMNEWTGSITETEVEFLLSLENQSWNSVHPLHIDESIQICIENGNSAGAIRFIQFKEKENLTEFEYNELYDLALQHSDIAVFDYITTESGIITIFNLDLGSLAENRKPKTENRKLFKHGLPKIMEANIYATLDPAPRSDGTSIGRLYTILENENEEAGLFLVQNYDLTETWKKAADGCTLLMDVCHAGNLSVAKFLTEEKGADIHAESGYRELCGSLYGYTPLTERKLQPIFFAAQNGNSELIKYLLSKGANVNARSSLGITPLMHAASFGHLDSAKILLNAGAFVSARTACVKPQETLYGRSKDATEGKFSPIFFAAENGHCELIRFLVENGAHVNSLSHFGTTPLMHAVSNGHLDAVKTLIELSADVNRQMKSQFKTEPVMKNFGAFNEIRSAYWRVASAGHIEIMSVLLQAGARL